MNRYRLIGGDGKEYGPASAEEVRRWFSEHRLQTSSLVRIEGTTEWKPLSLFPELSGVAYAGASPEPFATTAILTAQQNNGMATAGLVSSCIGLVCCGCSPAAILGIVFSCIALSQANRDPAQTSKPLAIAGLVIGIVALVGNVVAVLLGVFSGVMEEIFKH